MMNETDIYPLEYIDETLDINATDNYHLTVELSEAGLSLAILDLLRGKYVLLRYYSRETEPEGKTHSFSDLIEADDFLRREYKKIDLLMPTLHSTMVPLSVYDPGQCNDYYKINFGTEDKNGLITHTLSFPEAMVLYSPDSGAAENMASRWPDITPWHHTKPLLYHVSAASRSTDSHYVHIHYEKDFVTVVIAERRNLIFCNSFPITTPQEGAYFLFNILDRKSLRHDETIYVSGMIDPFSEAHLALLNFSPGIRFATPMIKFSYSWVMNELHLHRWLNLFSAASCE